MLLPEWRSTEANYQLLDCKMKMYCNGIRISYYFVADRQQKPIVWTNYSFSRPIYYNLLSLAILYTDIGQSNSKKLQVIK